MGTGALQSIGPMLVQKRPLLVVILVATLYHLVRLGSTDLHEWDEAVYSVRALAILQHGQWLDQTAGSIGGLWSSAHPPFVLWMMALSSKLFGLGEWSLRLPSALCGIGCAIALYFMARMLGRGRDLSPVTAVGLVLLPYFTRFARMAQLDAPVLFWSLLCLLFFWMAGNRNGAWFVASGVALGIGLLAKIAVALFAPLSLAAFLVLQLLRRDAGRERVARVAGGLLVTLGVGILVAAPWFTAMAARHGAPFWDRYFGYHVLARIAQPLEGHDSTLGVLFYPQQVLKAFGVLVPLLVLGIHAAHRRDGLSPRSSRFLLAWLVVPLVVFSLAATKLGIYVLMFIAPLVLYVSVGLQALRARRVSTGTQASVLPLAIAALVYAQTNPLHRGLESWVTSLHRLTAPPAGAALALPGFLAVVVAAVVLCVRWHARLGDRGKNRWRTTTWVVLLVGTVVPSFGPLTKTRSSWKRMQARVRELSPQSIVLVGEESTVNRYYLQSMGGRRELDWRIVGPQVFEADAARERAPESADALIFQRGRSDGARLPAGYMAQLETEELILYVPSGVGESSSTRPRSSGSATF